MKTAAPIILIPEKNSTLDIWVRERSLPLRLVQRAQIIRMAADGMQNQDVARGLGISRPTVKLWWQRFFAFRLVELEKDAPRPGRIPKITWKKIQSVVEATLHTTPPKATHWSTRSMAKAQGLSENTIQRIWNQHNLKPHLLKTFKLSRDKHFAEKLYDVAGLSLNPPDKSLVLRVDEKSQIQALERTQSGLLMKKGRCGTMVHDYKRSGTATLFSALSVLDGRVIGDCMSRHRHQEFIRFLKRIDGETPAGLDLNLIVDN
jgi:transposase